MAFSGAMVEKSADQTGANYSSETAVAWNQEVYDTDSIHDNVTNNSRLTVPSGWNYAIVTGTLRVQSNDDEQIIATIWKNGSASFDGAAQLAARSGGNGFAVCVKTGPVPVTAGDYFEITLDTAADTSIDIIAARSNFSMYKVG